MSLDDSVPDDIRQAPENKERALSDLSLLYIIYMRKVTNNSYDFQSFIFNLMFVLMFALIFFRLFSFFSFLFSL